MARAIGFVTALYHDAPRVRTFVRHLHELRRPADVALHAVVVDNSSPRRPVWISDASVYTAPHNLGYFGGCAWALEQWLGEGGSLPDWICVSNSDLEVADDFLLRLFAEPMEETVSVIAPSVSLPDGAQQNPLLWRRPTAVMMLAYAVLTRSALFTASFDAFIRLRHYWRRLFDRGNGDEIAPIYAPHGSIVLLHRRFFERGCTLRYGGLMYGEEIHLAEQVRRAGMRMTWRRDLQVVHRQHATTGLVSREQRRLWQAESANALWRDYFAGDK